MNNIIPGFFIVISSISGQAWESVPVAELTSHQQLHKYSPDNYGAVSKKKTLNPLPDNCAILENGKTVGFKFC